jgi:glycine/serine hydroxymethyltransferase
MAYFFQSDIKTPLEFWFDCFGGSTHKTFPGGHKAIFCTNDIEIYKRIWQTTKVFVSHTHTYDLAILARVLDDMNGRWDDYISTITKITKLLRGTFLKMWFQCIDFSDTPNHQIMVYHPDKDIAELNKKFTENGILFNYLILWDKKILRIWVQEFAYMQPTTDEIMIVIKYILQIYSGLRVDRKIISSLKNNLLK